jgi:lysophospholipase L1-like esterase
LKRNPTLANAVVLMVSVAVALIAAEALARLLGTGPRFGRLILNRGTLTRTVDGVPLWNDARPRYTDDDVRRAAADPEAFTVVGLGDSIMYGVRQPKETTYLEQARRLLVQRSGRRVETLNLAVPGYNTMQENIVYKEIAARVAPDLVLVHYWTDDVHQYRAVGGHVVDLGNVSEEDAERLVRALPLPAPIGDFLLVHSRLYDMLTQVVVAAGREQRIFDWSRVSAPLAEIQQRAQRSGARLVVLASAALDGDAPIPIADLARLRKFAADRDIEVIDVSEWLEGYRSKEVGIDMCHFSALGHQVVGERLAEYVLEKHLSSAPVPLSWEEKGNRQVD